MVVYLDAKLAFDGGPTPAVGCPGSELLWTDFAPGATPSSLAGFGGGEACGATAGWNDGSGGRGLAFDGYSAQVITDYVQTSVTAYSVEAWVKTTASDLSSGLRNQVIFQDRGAEGSGGQSLTLYLEEGRPTFVLDIDGAIVGQGSQRQINDGKWHHLVGTWSAPASTWSDPSQFALFVDGAAPPTNVYDQYFGISPYTGLGQAQVGHHDAWRTFFRGTLGGVVVFTRSLSASEALDRCQAKTADYPDLRCGSLSDSLADGGEPNAFPVLYPAADVLNIDWGPAIGTLSTMTGPAVVGGGSTDAWNGADPNGNIPDYAFSGLVNADGTPSPVTVQVTNLPGHWSGTSPTGVQMANDFSYSWSGSTASVELDALPEGTYDLYVYGSGGYDPNAGYASNSTFQVQVLDATSAVLSQTATLSTTTGADANLPYFNEGSQYVVFHGVSVASGARALVEIGNGIQGSGNAGCLLYGMQVVRTGGLASKLWALHDTLVNPGDTLALDGLFGAGATVHFAGGATVDLGVNFQASAPMKRATVTVPAGAQSGPVYVTSSLGLSNPVNLEVSSSAIGLQAFQHDYTQASYARAATDTLENLGEIRGADVPVQTSGFAYLFGGLGYGAQTQNPPVLRARINADDTLGVWELEPNQLPQMLYAPAPIVVGSWLYVIGGGTLTGINNAILRAPVAADGSLGAWEDSGVQLVHHRWGAQAAIIGNRVYVIGGWVQEGTTGQTQYAPIVEYADILPDGSLGAFQESGATLQTPRYQFALLVTPTRVYAAGGESADGSYQPQASVESAPINADGSLGAFGTEAFSLSRARGFTSSATAGNHFFTCAGYNGSQMDDCDEAVIDPASGTISSFSLSPHHLTGGSSLDPNFRVGNTLYIGGVGSSTADYVQANHASLNAGGAVGSFAASASSTLNTPRRSFAGAVWGNRFYAMAGQQDAAQGYAFLNQIESAPIGLDGTLGAFTNSATTTADRTSGVNAAVIGDTIYLVGEYGLGDNGCQGNSVETIHLARDGGVLSASCSEAPPTVVNRGGPSLAVYQGKLYAVGGGTAEGTAEAASIFTDGGLGTFAMVGNLQAPENSAGSAVIGNAMYLFGGVDPGGNRLSSVQVMPGNPDAGAPMLGTFAVKPGVTLTTPLSQAMTAVVGSNVYLFGGYSTSAVLGIERASFASGALQSFADAGALPLNLNEAATVVAGDTCSIIAGDETPAENIQSGVYQAPLQ